MFGNAFAGFIATEIRGRRFTCNSDLGTDIARSLNLPHSDIAQVCVGSFARGNLFLIHPL